ncbi:MAG: hypothetical protein A2X59_06925 [Nitrospirae bacterium GWC2_42_7]|nr:MAG: hypothetical protein A2X59_06925 [Nitrospirae bacterium GWC2_42_7]
MREIEVKILEINRDDIEKKLVSFGAKKIFEGEMHALYYDSGDGSIRKNKDTLRIRKEGSRAVLAFKNHVENKEVKIREENEVEISDFNTMQKILGFMGFSVWLEMKKRRITYEYDGLHFEIDKYHGEYEYIPEFMEIEGMDIEKVYKYAEILGFIKEDCLPWDATQLAEYYKNPGFMIKPDIKS